MELENYINKITQGDSITLLKDIQDDSIDLLCTDPPYALVSGSYRDDEKHQGGFMSKVWDSKLISVEVWRECLRVLKPGAFAFVMSSPRQDVLSRMIVRLEDAGFNTNFSFLAWAFASGFPKALSISKAVDRRACLRELKEKLGRKPSKEEFIEAWKNYREVIGEYSTTIPQISPRDNFGERYSDEGIVNPITTPKSPEAKELDGSYTMSLKPAVEVIIVAMKPLSEKNYLEQALKNKHGITWLDDCRIPYINETANIGGRVNAKMGGEGYGYKLEGRTEDITEVNARGRFPANLLVSENILDDGIKRRSIQSKVVHQEYGDSFKFGGGLSTPTNQYNDSGDFSRYFSLDAWWDEKIKNLPLEIQKTFPFLIVPKASRSERDKGLEMFEEKVVECLEGNKDGTLNKRTDHQPSKAKNFHPTCKPLKLMSYLVTLGSRENDVVLDPFVGSGTTALACKILNRKYIGMEISEEYCKIAEARLTNTTPKNTHSLADFL